MEEMLAKDFKNLFKEIKSNILNSKYDIYRSANVITLKLYNYLGKIVYENSKYGNSFISTLSKALKLSFPNIKGFSERNLLNMKKYYIECTENDNYESLSQKIPWSHNMIILSKVKNKTQRKWYIEQTAENGWSYDELALQIKSNLYKRQVLGDKPNNFQNTLSVPQRNVAIDMLKDPYILNLSGLKENFIETELEQAMVTRIKDILLELGNGFSFIGNQYKICVDNKDYYIDMLFYHTKLHCYVVVELKNTEYKPEYAGKLNFYLSAVDDLIKSDMDNPSIGIILCREKSKFSVEYSLRDINKPIGVSSYEISKVLPKDVLKVLPTEEDLNLHIDILEDEDNN